MFLIRNYILSTIFFFMVLVGQAFAGDYMLYVADKGNRSKCANQKKWTVKTSEEVAISFRQYFFGKKPDISILSSAFANGHFRFCGSREKDNVLKVLYEIKKEEELRAHKSHINDFIGKIESMNLAK